MHAIVLVKDEAKHIERCINSLRDICEKILVVDSGSSDQTSEIASEMGARVIFNPWINYSEQFNFGIDNSDVSADWLLRIDADEYVVNPGEVRSALSENDAHTSGLLVRRQIVFMGRRIRYGGIEPSWQLRLWKKQKGRCESRWMDEHIIVDGRVKKSNVSICDHNLNSIDWWMTKHNSYASREAIDAFLKAQNRHQEDAQHQTGVQSRIRRILKIAFYKWMPPGLRSVLYFIYRYIFRLGLLDGASGFYFHFLQGAAYRTLVDAKIEDIEKYRMENDCTLRVAVLKRTGFDVESLD